MAIRRLGPTWDAGTDGVDLSTANSGSVAQNFPTGSIQKFSAAAASHGAMGVRFQNLANGSTFRRWAFSVSSVTTYSYSVIFRIPSFPAVASAARICSAAISSGAGRAFFQVLNTGRLEVFDTAAQQIVAPGGIVAGTRYRLVMNMTNVATSAGASYTAKCYQQSAFGDYSQQVGVTVTRSGLTLGTGAVVGVDLGLVTTPSGSQVWEIQFDELQLQDGVATEIPDHPMLTGPTGIGTGQAVGGVEVSAPLVASPSGIATGAQMGGPTAQVTAGVIAVAPVGIGTGLALGTPALAPKIASTPTGIATAAALGSPAVTAVVSVTPTGVTTAAAPGAPGMTSSIVVAPTGVPTAQATGTPQVAVPTVVGVAGIASGQAVGAPQASVPIAVAPLGVASAAALGAIELVIGNRASPAGVTSAAQPGVPTIRTTVRVAPSGVASAAAAGAPVARPVLTASPAGVAPAAQLGAPVVAALVVVHLAGLESAAALDAPSIAVADVALPPLPEVVELVMLTEPTRLALTTQPNAALDMVAGEPLTLEVRS